MQRQLWRQNVLFAILMVVFLTAGLAPRSQADTPLGAGLNGQVDYSGDFAFVDTLVTAGAFHALNPGGGLDLSTLAPTNAHGYPTTDFGFYVNECAPQPGTYKLITVSNTQPTVQLLLTPGTITNTVWNAATHTFTADVNVQSQGTPGTPGQFVLQFQNTGGGVSSIHLYRPGYAQSNAITNLYTTNYLNLLTVNNPNVLRFMDFHFTNGNIETDWADRSVPSDATQELSLSKTNLPVDGTYPNADTYPYDNGVLTTGKGVCWEYIIALANQQNKDAWINIPITASPDYVLKLAQLIKYGSNGTNPYTSTQANPIWPPLKSNLNVWVEYSNEVWNDQFVQAHINRGLGLTEVASGTSWGGGAVNLNYDNVNDVFAIGDRRVADHLKQISDIFRGVFGTGSINTRVRPILAYQLAPFRFSNQLAYIEAVYGAGAAKNNFYGIAVAPYFNLNGADSNPNLTRQQVLDALASSIADYQNGPILTQIATIATYYGLKMTAYEGGPDTFGPNNIQAKKDATLDPQMQTLVVNYLNAWYSHGGDQFNWFVIGAGSYDGQYGTYSITNDLNDLNQPKELGYRQVRSETLPAVTTGFAVPGEVDARFSLYGPGAVNSGGYYVRFIGAGSTFDYLVNAPTAGTYKISVSAGDGNSAAAPLDILLNDALVQTVTVPAAGNNQFLDTTPISITLNAGLNTVRLRVPDNRPYNINSIKLTKADGTGITNTLPMSSFYEFGATIYANQTYTNTFEVHDNESPASAITVIGTSDNQTLIPNANIKVVTGSFNVYGTILNRQLSILPAADQTGTANITLTLTDGSGRSRVMTFRLTVNAGFTSAPINLTATPGNNKVALNWQQGTDGAGATSFIVLRSTTTGGPYSQIAAGLIGLTYTDTTALNGTTYYYVVYGTSVSGGDSGYSNEASATPFNPPTAPVLTAAASYGTVTLTWTASTGAATYDIYRGAAVGGPFTQIATGYVGQTYVDSNLTNGTPYYYYVVGVGPFGPGPASNIASATPSFTVPGEIEARAPNGVNANNGNFNLNLFGGTGGTYNYYVSSPTAKNYKVAVSIGLGSTGTLQLSINGGTPVSVAIPNVNGSNTTIGFADTVPVTLPFTAGVNTLTVVLPQNTHTNSIKITNTDGTGIANTLPMSDLYEFYPGIGANTSLNDIFDAWDNENLDWSKITFTAVSDNPALVPNANISVPFGVYNQYGTNYNRRLIVTPLPDQSGTANIALTMTDTGGLSRTATFRLTVAAPATPNAPTGLSGSLENQKTTLTWNATKPDNNNPTGASGYNVYRSLTAGGPYTKIATVTGTTFTNTGLTNGTTYYYVVTATSGSGAFESAYSNEAAVTPQNVIVGNGDGLYGQYYTNDDPTFTFTGKTPFKTGVDATINFSVDGPNYFPTGVPHDHFTARWTGLVQAPASGNYVFTISSDDGSVLYVNGVKVIDNNAYQGVTAKSSAPIALVAGQKYAIEMDFYQGGGGGVAQLAWSYGSVNNQIIPQTQLYSNQGATVSGRIALEGVADLSKTNPAVSLGTYTVEFRTPGTLNVVKTANVSITPVGANSAYGTFSVSGVANGTYDVAIKGHKSLRVLLSGVVVNGAKTLADVLLPGGDATDDNAVDIGDFGVLVNAYSGDVSIPDSGYDATADFNYDGIVDIADFGILINEYSNSGAP